MNVYFDRNIFSTVRKQSALTNNNMLRIMETAVKENKINILFSHTLIEETLPTIAVSKTNLREELDIISKLVNTRKIVKYPKLLLTESVESYAYGKTIPKWVLETENEIQEFLETGKASFDLDAFLSTVNDDKEQFTNDLERAFTSLRNTYKMISFDELWKQLGLDTLKWLAERQNLLEMCEERGIEGLLEIKPLRLYAIYYVNLVYSKLFGEQGNPGKIISSERGDFFHAVQSSVADVFVTEDRKLNRWLQRIPVNNYEVKTLEEFYNLL